MIGIRICKFTRPTKVQTELSDLLDKPMEYTNTILRFTDGDLTNQVVQMIYAQICALESYMITPKRIICGKKVYEAIATYMYQMEYSVYLPSKFNGLEIEYSFSAPPFELKVLPGTVDTYTYQEEIQKLLKNLYL